MDFFNTKHLYRSDFKMAFPVVLGLVVNLVSRLLDQTLGVGVTAVLSNLMQSLRVILANQFLLPYGNDKIAAMGIVLKISMIATGAEILRITGKYKTRSAQATDTPFHPG